MVGVYLSIDKLTFLYIKYTIFKFELYYELNLYGDLNFMSRLIDGFERGEITEM
jgi:hypothetical protein